MNFFDPGYFERRDELRSTAPISVEIDPGSTRYLLNASHAQAEEAFRKEFESVNFEPYLPSLHSSAAGTTLQIILTGVSLGAGIVATEFLKEVGKKLWKTVEGIKKPSESSDAGYKGDTVKIELRMEHASVNATIQLGRGDGAQLAEFLTSAPAQLFDQAVKLLGTGMPCSGCRHEQRVPTEIPCRYCARSGAKLRVVNNELCAMDGTPMREKYDPAAQKGDFYIATFQSPGS